METIGTKAFVEVTLSYSVPHFLVSKVDILSKSGRRYIPGVFDDRFVSVLSINSFKVFGYLPTYFLLFVCYFSSFSK